MDTFPKVTNEETQHISSLPNKPFPKKTSIVTRKASIMAQKSHLRTPRVCESGASAYTPPPILSPMRNGSGLFWQIAKALGQQHISPLCVDSTVSNGFAGEDPEMECDRLHEGDERVPNSEDADGKHGPMRKNGFFYMGNQHNQVNFEKQLEALRKDSWASTSSKTSMTTDDRNEALRKASSVSECYYDYYSNPHETDVTPHINLGRDYQARVKKWADRVIAQEERDAIEDRDECVFDSNLIDHLSSGQLDAYELLACSQAVPRPGRNKELALHLLTENKGNLEAAVMDLLRSDTLDWEQYRTIYDSIYPDSTPWASEEIASFQDALYKTEKDFHQVAQELTNKTVNECVEFYYMWKKACPDDYRKLRNLRRKRQLLEAHMPSNTEDVPPPPAKRKHSDDEQMDELDSDATSPSFSIADTQEQRTILPSVLAHSPSSVGSRCLPAARKNSGHANGSPCGLLMAGPSHMMPQPSVSPSMKDISGMQNKYQPSHPRGHIPQQVVVKKGAQPSADGFFHCRLCDKCFEKVKSLNAHMKSHAMKARAEAEAQAQVQAQVNAQINAAQQQAVLQQSIQQHVQGLTPAKSLSSPQSITGLTNGLTGGLPQNAGLQLGQTAQTLQSLQQNLQQNISPQSIVQGIANNINNIAQGLATQAIVEQQLGLAHPLPQHPILQSQSFGTIIH